MTKTNSPAPPFPKLGRDIFRYKNNLRRPPDELVLFRIGIGRYQREHRGTVRGRDGYPAPAGLEAGIKGQLKSKLIEVKSETSLLISNENSNGVKTEIRILLIEAKTGAAHRRHYRWESDVKKASQSTGHQKAASRSSSPTKNNSYNHSMMESIVIDRTCATSERMP